MKFSIFSIILILIGAMNSFAYENCPIGKNKRSELDNMSPRLEGKFLPKRCPYQEKPAIACHYYRVLSSGTLSESMISKTYCENGDPTKSFSETCCQEVVDQCFDAEQHLAFKARLIKRPTVGCCWEDCPDLDYWVAPPVTGVAGLLKAGEPWIEMKSPSVPHCIVGTSCGGQAKCTAYAASGKYMACPTGNPSPNPAPNPPPNPPVPLPPPINPGGS